MITPVELFVGLRYLRAKRRTRFVSFITLISLLGIALGVTALIVILSVMNGFEGELRERLLSMSAHGSVAEEGQPTRDWTTLAAAIEAESGIVAAAPLVRLEGMLQADRGLQAVVVNGIDPERERRLADGMLNVIEGSLDELVAGERSLILGRLLAFDTGAAVGESVTLLIPRPVGDGTMEPVLERFTVRGLFDAGIQDHDARLALMHYSDAAEILGLGDGVNAVRFRASDVMQAPAIAARLGDRLDNVETSDWTVENASYFRAIRLEKMMMSLILSLIIGVAAFNIVASLVMVVTDKTNDIAVLRTLGMSPRGVVRVFFVQGAMIGWAGVLFGTVLGVLLAIYVPVIAPVLERVLGFQIMPGDVYYVTRIPSILDWQHVAIIATAAFVLTSLATLYPARRAAHINPAVALRYE
ncbi:MAG: lipoprotein-releasing ABC transporter permease subunit [Pseudomonadota bacterium]